MPRESRKRNAREISGEDAAARRLRVRRSAARKRRRVNQRSSSSSSSSSSDDYQGREPLPLLPPHHIYHESEDNEDKNEEESDTPIGVPGQSVPRHRREVQIPQGRASLRVQVPAGNPAYNPDDTPSDDSDRSDLEAGGGLLDDNQPPNGNDDPPEGGSDPEDPGGPVDASDDDGDPQEDPRKIALVTELAKVKSRCKISDTAMNEMWRVAYNFAEDIADLKREGAVTASYRWSIRPSLVVNVPRVTYGCLIEDTSADPEDRISYIDGLSVVPEAFITFPAGGPQKMLRQDGRTTLQELKRFHWGQCQKHGADRRMFLNHLWNMDFSSDGVKESNCSQRTLLICSIRLGRSVYLYQVFNPLLGNPDAKPTIDDVLRPLVREVAADPEMRLRFIIADKVERHRLRGMKSHAGAESCEVCTAIARTGPIHWPWAECSNFPERDVAEMVYAATHLHARNLNHRGIIAYTPIYELPHPFHPIFSMPTDIFHLLYEGVVKLMLTRLFESTTAETVATLQEWSRTYERTRLIKEISRYSRKIVVSQFKGCEFGVLLMAGFPSLVSILEDKVEDHWEHAQLCLAIICFLARSYNVPEADYRAISASLGRMRFRGERLTFKQLHELFAQEFELGFCCKAAHRPTANVHCFYHLWRMREMTGLPLWVSSAEAFEAYYSILRNCFTSGTRNVPKQLFENAHVRMKYNSFAFVERTPKIRLGGRRQKVRDNLVYLKDGTFAEIYQGEGPWHAHPVLLRPFNPAIGISLPWHLTGVHEYRGVDRNTVLQINKEDLAGKGIIFGNIITSWLMDWSLSKKDE